VFKGLSQGCYVLLAGTLASKWVYRDGVEEADEYCPHCDNHYVIPAVEPKPMMFIEGDDPRFMQQDLRIKPKEYVIPEDELLDILNC
jgi:hypothetical protein